jgi:hypothetical protein
MEGLWLQLEVWETLSMAHYIYIYIRIVITVMIFSKSLSFM